MRKPLITEKTFMEIPSFASCCCWDRKINSCNQAQNQHLYMASNFLFIFLYLGQLSDSIWLWGFGRKCFRSFRRILVTGTRWVCTHSTCSGVSFIILVFFLAASPMAGWPVLQESTQGPRMTFEGISVFWCCIWIVMTAFIPHIDERTRLLDTSWQKA